MLEELKKLANTLDGEAKSKVLAEITRLESLQLVSKPNNLDDLLKSEDYADLKNQFNSKLGSYRTTWEKENAEAKAVAEKEKELQSKITGSDNPELISQIKDLIDSSLKGVNEKINEFTTVKKIEELKAYSNEKAKDLPETLRGLVIVNQHSTQEEIDSQIGKIQETHKALMKDIDHTPEMGNGQGGAIDANFDDALKEFGDSIEVQK